MQIAVLVSVWEAIRKPTSGRVFWTPSGGVGSFRRFFEKGIMYRVKPVERLVIKVGTGVFRSSPGGIEEVCSIVAFQALQLMSRGIEVIIISSGAIFTAQWWLSLHRREMVFHNKQALATIGQPKLMRYWGENFSPTLVSQVLVTDASIMHRVEWENTHEVIECCLSEGVVPIVNENDGVSFEEYVTDNDNLTALLAPALKADAVQFLTAVGGVCAGVPGTPEARLYLEIDAEHPPKVDASVSENGRGGMRVKIACGQKCLEGGARRVAITGLSPDIILRFAQGEIIPTTIGKANRLLES